VRTCTRCQGSTCVLVGGLSKPCPQCDGKGVQSLDPSGCWGCLGAWLLLCALWGLGFLVADLLGIGGLVQGVVCSFIAPAPGGGC
jgi:hypothetical protein